MCAPSLKEGKANKSIYENVNIDTCVSGNIVMTVKCLQGVKV